MLSSVAYVLLSSGLYNIVRKFSRFSSSPLTAWEVRASKIHFSSLSLVLLKRRREEYQLDAELDSCDVKVAREDRTVSRRRRGNWIDVRIVNRYSAS